MHDAASLVGQYDEDKQQSERQCEHDEKVHGNELPKMVFEERAPSLRRGFAAAGHVLRD